MSDAVELAEAALYERLSTTVTLARVFQDAPADQPLPVVIIGDLKAFPLGTKQSDADRRIDAVVVTMVSADERAPVLAIQAQVQSSLDDAILVAPGWTFDISFQDDDAVLGEDGSTYIGTSAFTIFALAD